MMGLRNRGGWTDGSAIMKGLVKVISLALAPTSCCVSGIRKPPRGLVRMSAELSASSSGVGA